MRKKTKWRISAVVFEKKTKIYPALKSPTHIGFIGVIKYGSKISHLGTFKIRRLNFYVDETQKVPKMPSEQEIEEIN